jgi:uncharacterized protein YbjQ (UPF0145 family)
MIIATTENVAGHRVVETKGTVFGVVVRSRSIGGNVMAILRSLGGGEITEYTQLLEETRRQAVSRMVDKALAMGANANPHDALRLVGDRHLHERDRGLRHRRRGAAAQLSRRG